MEELFRMLTIELQSDVRQLKFETSSMSDEKDFRYMYIPFRAKGFLNQKM